MCLFAQVKQVWMQAWVAGSGNCGSPRSGTQRNEEAKPRRASWRCFPNEQHRWATGLHPSARLSIQQILSECSKGERENLEEVFKNSTWGTSMFSLSGESEDGHKNILLQLDIFQGQSGHEWRKEFSVLSMWVRGGLTEEPQVDSCEMRILCPDTKAGMCFPPL